MKRVVLVGLLAASAAAVLPVSTAAAARTTTNVMYDAVVTGPSTDGTAIGVYSDGGTPYVEKSGDAILNDWIFQPAVRAFRVVAPVVEDGSKTQTFTCRGTDDRIYLSSNALVNCAGGVFVDYPPYGNTTAKSLPPCATATTTSGVGTTFSVGFRADGDKPCPAQVWVAQPDGKNKLIGTFEMPFKATISRSATQ